VLAYILDPVVRVLERRGLSRELASATVVVLALAAIVTVVAVAANEFAREAGVFYRDVAGEPAAPAVERSDFTAGLVAASSDPASARLVSERVHEVSWNGRELVYFDRDGDGAYQPGYAALGLAKVQTAIQGARFEEQFDRAMDGLAQVGPKFAQSAGDFLTGLVRGGSAVLEGFLSVLTIVVLFPIYLYYSLVNLARVYDVGVRHLPQGQRPQIQGILHKIHVTMSAFFRGRLITMFAKGVLLLALFWSFGVPFAYVCAAFAALASLVPVVGGIAAGVPPLVLALPDSSGGELAGLLAGILVIEIIEGYVLIPALVGKSVGLHPLTVLVCTLVAGNLLGFFGMIVAVPLTAVLKILAEEFVLPEVRRRAGLVPPATPDAVMAQEIPAAPTPPDAAESK